MRSLAATLGALAFAACSVPSPTPPEPTAPSPAPAHASAALQHQPTRAVRYAADVVTERLEHYDITELFLLDDGIACNVSEDLSIGPDQRLVMHPFARAFRYEGPRNQDCDGNQRPTERIDLPADLATQLIELATLTARQRELALQIGPQLAPFLHAPAQR